MKKILSKIVKDIKILRYKDIKLQRGFTLIELLVVIGILGILASALVAAIDPFEQLKKANDSNVKNTTVEYVNASIRYFTTHNAMPWDVDAGCKGQTGLTTLDKMTSCLSDLVGDGELKPGFTSVTSILSSIDITPGVNAVIACFNPKSKAQNHDINTKYNSAGVDQTPNCPVTSGVSTSCYWCAQ